MEDDVSSEDNVTALQGAREQLRKALQDHADARSEAEVKLAVLALHTGLEESFRAHLAALGFEDIGHRNLSFPDLVNLVRDHTDLFADNVEV